MKLFHFADAHIDMANYGKRDPATGLPWRVLDFLKSLDAIVDAAIAENADLVVFAGDAYKDRSPAPTFQREWGKRIMRLSQAKIPTLLLVGNHDVSPAIGRAHALHEFKTLQTPYVYVADKPELLSPNKLWGAPLQAIVLPWVTRSAFMANADESDSSAAYQQIEERLSELVSRWVKKADPALPLILVAHASIEGAAYGGERMVMLGGDLTLSGSLVKNKRFNYVALGHIHKPQDVNHGQQPPVIYPGSIERVDFGEPEERRFVVAHIEAGKDTRVEWRKLDTRKFIDRRVRLEKQEDVARQIESALPPQDELRDAVIRLIVEYPREWDSLIDEPAVRKYAEGAFEFHLIKRPQIEARVRLPEGELVSALSPLEALEQYWKAARVEDDVEELKRLARAVITGEEKEEEA